MTTSSSCMVPLLYEINENRKTKSCERWFDSIFLVKRENNPIAPEPTYTSHFDYYSTTRDEKRKAAAYWTFILLEVLTVSGRFMKYVKPGAWRNKTTFLTYCSVTWNSVITKKIQYQKKKNWDSFKLLKSNNNKSKSFPSQPSPCFQYNEGTTQMFEENQKTGGGIRRVSMLEVLGELNVHSSLIHFSQSVLLAGSQGGWS